MLKFQNRSFLLLTAAIGLTACERSTPLTAPQPQSDHPLSVVAGVFGAQRGLATSALLLALSAPGETDGTLLVGVKEPNGVRGVSDSCVELSLLGRYEAENAIRSAVPELVLVNGIDRVVVGVRNGRATTDTIHRTFLRVRPPVMNTEAAQLIDRLRADVHVDYNRTELRRRDSINDQLSAQ